MKKKIYITVKTNASVSEVIATSPDTFVVRVTASPHDGKANEAVVKALARYFGIASSFVTISKGITSKHKVVIISE